MCLTNFYFCRTFFVIGSYQILQNYAILVNHESFFQEKESPQLYRSQFLEINSSMAETIKNQFSKTKFLYSLNINQSKSTDYQWNLTDSNS